MKVADFIQSIFVGIFFVFILMCVFWVAIFVNYIQFYGIKEFFNPFFGNVFNGVIFTLLVVIFGLGSMINFLAKILRVIYGVLLLFSLILFVPSLGKAVGGILLGSKEVVLKNGEEIRVHSLYQNKFYIIYEEDKGDKKELVYYERP
ncbi:hypothetical protein [Helicobacter burdigaliensis]|uniref:hypothetical protein n=1 Tax=Helicobacter burdigaliensis TaxID=2315334 RepID=UPI000EF6C6BD|nr:hypothetical protein [Helicobacter burdigaliensis]